MTLDTLATVAKESPPPATGADALAEALKALSDAENRVSWLVAEGYGHGRAVARGIEALAHELRSHRLLGPEETKRAKAFSAAVAALQKAAGVERSMYPEPSKARGFETLRRNVGAVIEQKGLGSMNVEQLEVYARHLADFLPGLRNVSDAQDVLPMPREPGETRAAARARHVTTWSRVALFVLSEERPPEALGERRAFYLQLAEKLILACAAKSGLSRPATLKQAEKNRAARTKSKR